MLVALTVVFLLTVIFAVSYVFLIMPRVTDRADMDMLSTDYAHRGLWGEKYPENSLPAFALAVERGYGIELDVRLSADGEVMVFHDEKLRRMCGVDGAIGDYGASELQRMGLANTSYGIPTFAKVLEIVDGKVPLLIEIKGEGKEEKLCRKLSVMLDTYNGAFAVQSFSPLVLSWFKRYRPRFARGQLVTRVRRVEGKRYSHFLAFLLSNMLLNVMSRPDFISMDVRRLHNFGFRLCVPLFKCKAFVWTVRTGEQYKKVRTLGLFAIFEKITP